jgi:hypothetical protein
MTQWLGRDASARAHRINAPGICRHVLANYHELERLVQQLPEELWDTILKNRFTELTEKRVRPAPPVAPGTVEAPAAPAGSVASPPATPTHTTPAPTTP